MPHYRNIALTYCIHKCNITVMLQVLGRWIFQEYSRNIPLLVEYSTTWPPKYGIFQEYSIFSVSPIAKNWKNWNICGIFFKKWNIPQKKVEYSTFWGHFGVSLLVKSGIFVEYSTFPYFPPPQSPALPVVGLQEMEYSWNIPFAPQQHPQNMTSPGQVSYSEEVPTGVRNWNIPRIFHQYSTYVPLRHQIAQNWNMCGIFHKYSSFVADLAP